MQANGVWEISGWLEEGMWCYGDFPGPTSTMAHFERVRTTTVRNQGFETERLVLGTHTGTYVETAAHLVEGGRRLNSVGLEELVRPAKLVRVPNIGPGGWVSAKDLEEHAPKLVPGDAVLIDTGWGSRWNSPEFAAQAPAYAPDCAAWLRSHRPGLLGVDVPFLNSRRPDEPSTTILEDLFERDGILLAPVRLDAVPPHAGESELELIAMPLPIVGACAAPCRALLRSI